MSYDNVNFILAVYENEYSFCRLQTLTKKAALTFFPVTRALTTNNEISIWFHKRIWVANKSGYFFCSLNNLG